MNATDRAALLSIIPADRAEHFSDALAVIEHGTATGGILNVDFQDAKRTIDYTVEKAFAAATDSFWHGKGGKLDSNFEVNEALNNLQWNCRLTYARDAIAAGKKLAKVKVSHPMVAAYRAVAAAVLPLAQEMEALKPLILKGRRPPTAEVQAARAAKLAAVKSMPRATCGCCFAEQAVLPNGRIHDHGYTLPEAWMKTGSCYGVSFRPLEVSDEGPKYMVTIYRNGLKSLQDGEKAIQAATSFSVPTKHEWRHGHRVPVEFKDLLSNEAGFAAEKSSRLDNNRAEQGRCQRGLERFEKVVAEWKAA